MSIAARTRGMTVPAAVQTRLDRALANLTCALIGCSLEDAPARWVSSTNPDSALVTLQRGEVRTSCRRCGR